MQTYEISMKVDRIDKDRDGKRIFLRKDNWPRKDTVMEISEVGLPPLEIDEELTVSIVVIK